MLQGSYKCRTSAAWSRHALQSPDVVGIQIRKQKVLLFDQNLQFERNKGSKSSAIALTNIENLTYSPSHNQ